MKGRAFMTIIPTDRWLFVDWDNPVQLCRNLCSYFNASASEIYGHLAWHGMYQREHAALKDIILMKENRIWEKVEEEIQSLRATWDGPDVPVFIFPSDYANRDFLREFDAKSGLAYRDKLFLFLKPDQETAEIKSLVAHEYNHVCRLNRYSKPERDYLLLDTIILEGLAESAVFELYGEEQVSSWAFKGTDGELESMWNRYMLPNLKVDRTTNLHHELLYGSSDVPELIGYRIGFYLVQKFRSSSRLSMKELLQLDSDEFAVRSN